MQVKNQQLELDMEQQTGSKLGKEYIKAVYCHPVYLTYMQSSVQFSPLVVSDSLRPHGLQHARPPCLSPTHRNLLKFTSIELVMPSNYLVLCRPLLLPSIFPSIRVFFNDLALHIKWPKYWSFSFSFSISPSDEYSGLISLQSKGFSRVFSNTTVGKHQFFCIQTSL